MVRIAVCGIGTESCGFSRHVTTRRDFVELRGADLCDVMDSLVDPGWTEDIEWVPILVASATPGGPVEPSVFDSLVDEIVDRLSSEAVDGVYLDLHGAVLVTGRRDAEERLLRAVRGAVGGEPVISASMDPHGNLSRELAGMLDLASAHRHSPHIDQAATKTRAIRKLLDVLATGRRPVKAWVRVPLLLPGELTATTVEPGRSVFAASAEVAARNGIVDANLWTGFAWADEPRCAGSVLVTADDVNDGRAAAEELARYLWDARAAFSPASSHHGTFDEALDHVLAGARRPCFISDAGDNVTAGASGDLTYCLERVIDRSELAGSTVLIAGLYDPASVSRAVTAGRGGVVEEPVGAWLDDRYGSPVPGPWRVEDLITGPFDTDVTAALLRRGHVWVSVQARRVLFGTTEDATAWPFDLQGMSPLDVSGFDAVVVKNGYLMPSQQERSGSAFLAVTPGATDIELSRLRYRDVERPVYPLDSEFSAPLVAEVIAPWEEYDSESA